MPKKCIKYKSDIEKHERIFFQLLPLIPCLVTFIRELDNDLWFLISHGRYVMNFGIPHVEPLTIHEGLNFVMQQWFSSVLFYLTYDVLGSIGIKILTFGCYIIGAYITFRICLLVSNKYFLSSVITLVYSTLILSFMVARPYIFSNIIFLLEIYYLEKYALNKSYEMTWILPILSTALINIQASMWPMLFIVLIPYAIDSLNFKVGPFISRGYGIGKILKVSLVMVISGFFNPYGSSAMFYLRNSYGVEVIDSIVSEMFPATIRTFFGVIILFTVIPICGYYLLSKSNNRSIRYILLALGTGYLSLSSYRGYIFFCSCSIFPIAAYLKEVQIPVYNVGDKGYINKLRRILASSILALSFILVLSYNNRSKESISNFDMLKDLIIMVSKDNSSSDVKLYTGYNDGCLAEFYGIRTYLDTRAEVFLKTNNGSFDILTEYYELQTGSLYYEHFLNKYMFTHIIVNKYDILETYLEYNDNYSLVSSNENYKLFKRIVIDNSSF